MFPLGEKTFMIKLQIWPKEEELTRLLYQWRCGVIVQ